MKYTIIFEEQSKKDFQNGLLYYNEISSDLADRFFNNLRNVVDDVEKNPLHYQVRYRGIRIAHCNNFPYSVHFLVEGKTINVLRILHQKKYYD